MRNSLKLKIIIFNLLSFYGVKNFSYLNDSETIEYLLKNKKSLIRWGDGESSCLLLKDIYFQKTSTELSSDLKSILVEYSAENSKYLLAGPNKYLSADILTLLYENKLLTWIKSRYVFMKYIKRSNVLGDAFVFRPLSQLSNEIVEKLWINHNIILVHPEVRVFEDFKRKYSSNKVMFIQIKSENAYSEINDISKNIFNSGFSKSNTRILISGGPAAKVIIKLGSDKGYIAYDMGQYFKWKFYNKFNEKGI